MKLLTIALSFLFCFDLNFCSAAYYNLKMVSPTESYSLQYNDNDIFVNFAFAKKDPDRLFVSIYNKTPEVLTIKWPQSSLIFNNKSYMVLPASQITAGFNAYSGVKETKIPPETTAEESLFAEGSISYVRESSPITIGTGWGRRHRGWSGWGGWIGFDDIFRSGWHGSWKVKPFFPSARKEVEKSNLAGTQVSLFLVYQVGDEEVNKRFDFVIDYASPSQSPGSFGALIADKTELDILKREHSIQSGILILDFAKKSAAKDAGLQIGDNIIQADQKEILGTEDFVRILNTKHAKDTLQIFYLRAGQKYFTEVKLKKI